MNISQVNVYRHNYNAYQSDYELIFSYQLEHDNWSRIDIADFVFDATNNPHYREEMDYPMFDVKPSPHVKFLEQWTKCRLAALSTSDRIEVEHVIFECDVVGWLNIKHINQKASCSA